MYINILFISGTLNYGIGSLQKIIFYSSVYLFIQLYIHIFVLFIHMFVLHFVLIFYLFINIFYICLFALFTRIKVELFTLVESTGCSLFICLFIYLCILLFIYHLIYVCIYVSSLFFVFSTALISIQVFPEILQQNHVSKDTFKIEN